MFFYFINGGLEMKNEKQLNLLATKLAKVRLSELGYNYIPDIYQAIKTFRAYIMAKAHIISSQGGKK
jgi:hypothetical protein